MNKNLYGILLIDKPEGITSFKVISILRKITGIKKIGHTGTLDPFATGLLPICIGKATRISDLLTFSSKKYKAEMIFGEQRDTGDCEGEIIKTDIIPNLHDIDLAELKEEICKIKKQIPPKYSAIKIDGKRAYKLARENKDFDIPERDIEINEFSFINQTTNSLTYSALVSKGTYIRVLTEDIAKLFGSIAYTNKLRRTEVGKISIKDAVKLDELNADNWISHLIPIEKILSDFPKIELNDETVHRIKNGQRIYIDHSDISKIMLTDSNGKCIGFGKFENSILQPRLVFI